MRQKVSDVELEAVSGGVTYSKKWGDGTLYRLRKNQDTEWRYTFPVERKEEVMDIINATADPNLNEATNDSNIMDALLAVPGLLSDYTGE